jgi:hypothetical protein
MRACMPYWKVFNTGASQATDCRGDLLMMIGLNDPTVRFPPGPLQWSSRSEMTQTTALTIPSGHSRFLDVAYLDPGHGGVANPAWDEWPLRIVRAGGEAHREARSVSRGSHRLLIRLSSAGRSSNYVVCDLCALPKSNDLEATMVHIGDNEQEARDLL